MAFLRASRLTSRSEGIMVRTRYCGKHIKNTSICVQQALSAALTVFKTTKNLPNDGGNMFSETSVDFQTELKGK
jgi:hypothetical protein